MEPTPKPDPERDEHGGSSLIDQVTDLPTVPLLFDRMRQQLEEQGFLGLLSVNILQNSNLEKVTGWQSFDRIVRDVGRFLASTRTTHLRREDFISEVMISGNAFIILLSPPRGRKSIELPDICQVRDRLHGKLRRFLARRLPADISERFTCYIGVSFVRNDPAMRTERLIYRALDEAQADSIAEKQRAAQRHLLTLREVLTARLVQAVYQPVVDIVQQRIIGYEALSRPAAGTFDTVEQLFKAAYEAESIWALERLCRQRAMESLPALGVDELLFLNIEPDSIYDPQFRSDRTVELLQEASLTPDRVVLEMTEHSAVRDFTAFRQTLTYFRSLGFRLAIDDMGSGYSALISVAEIQPDFLKIDMSLIREIHLRSMKRELVDTITRFSQRAGIEVVAEGVEQPGELETLKEIGVRFAQGYLFARPGSPPPVPDFTGRAPVFNPDDTLS